MMPMYLREWSNLLLKLSVFLRFQYSISSSKQCGLKTTETSKHTYVRNSGIALCQHKCIENIICLKYEYHIETLTCHLSRDEIKMKEGYIVLPGNPSYDRIGTNTCGLRSRCLYTRSGKAVRVKDEKHNYSESSPHDKKNISETNPLHKACLEGDLGQVKRILSKGLVDINSRGKEHGRTPLMIAAHGGYREIFDFLKGEGANMSQMDDDRNNILHLTCRSGEVEMARYIMSQNIIDVNSRGKSGRTSVMIAALWGHKHVFYLLISKGANVSLVDQNSDNILHVATIGGHVNIMKFVLSKEIADIDSRGKFGRTPLMRAAYYGHIDAFDFLVCMQGNVSLLDDGNCSLLHLAITGGHVQMVEYLLSQNFEDMNTRWAYGRTSLMIAAYYGHREIFDLLVSKGSDVSHVDDNGDNILHRACIGGYVKMVRYLLSQKIVDINSRGRFGRTSLLIAAYFGHREVLSLLLNEGGNASLVDSAGDTILHLSSLKGHLKIVKYVLSHDIVDINNRNNKRNTAAMIAKQKGYHAIYDLLVARGSKAS